MTHKLEEKMNGKASVWLPKGSVITRSGFSIDPSVGVFTSVDQVEEPFCYVVTLDKVHGFYNTLVNVLYGKTLRSDASGLDTGSFVELKEKGLLKEGGRGLPTPKVFMNSIDKSLIAPSYNPTNHISNFNQIEVSSSPGSLYIISQPIKFEIIKRLL